MTEVLINVNGVDYSRDIEPRMLLVHFIRDELNLTGTHIGCDTSQCGACTVLMNDLAVKCCTVFAVQAHKASVRTIEGLGNGDAVQPIQDAFRRHHALQCGFCTPGMIMAAEQILDRYPDADEAKIRHELDGNMCRCTGYSGIVAAILDVGKQRRGLAAVAVK